MSKHLWEIDHPYYCEPNNYFNNDCIDEYDSFSDFLEENGDAELDYNLLFRFDWQDAENPDHELDEDQLLLFFMGQRKGLYRSVLINVNKEDEQQIIEYLKPRFQYLIELWEPFNTEENP